MRYTALLLLLMLSTAFGALIVDWTPPDGTITLHDTWNLDGTYGRGCNDAACPDYPAGVDGQVTVNFTDMTDAYEGQIDVAGLQNCWITDCEKLDKTNCDPGPCPYEDCESLSPDDPAFDYGGGSSVDWNVIEGGGDVYDTHMKHETWSEPGGGPWPPSWPTVPPWPIAV